MMRSAMGARWATPVACVLTGVAMLAAAAVAGQVDTGFAMLAGTVVYAAVLVVFSGRSDTVALLRGEPADERLAWLNVRATAVAAIVATVAALGGFLWEIAHGRDGMAFLLVDLAAALGYLIALVWFRWHD